MTDIFEWINCISRPHDEWTDDTARIAMEIIRDEETRRKYNSYNEKDKFPLERGLGL